MFPSGSQLSVGLATQVALPTNDTVFRDLTAKQKDGVQDLERSFKDTMVAELAKIESETDKKHVGKFLFLLCVYIAHTSGRLHSYYAFFSQNTNRLILPILTHRPAFDASRS